MQLAGISSLLEEAQTSSLKKQTLNQEDFLNLLVTQLKNQDPMNPLDNAEFTSQIAQFNQLDEMFTVNDNLDKLDEGLMSINNFLLTTLIGKNAIVEGSTIHLYSTDGAPIGYTVDSDDVDVQIDIYDEAKKLVNTFIRGGMNEGFHEVMWDGKNSEGESLPLGEYTFKVSVHNDPDSLIEVLPYMTGKINEITLGQTPRVEVDGESFLLSDILKIKGGTN